MKTQAQTRMHNGMVMVLGPTQRLTGELKGSFDRILGYWLDEYGYEQDKACAQLLVEKARKRCQVSWNHGHFGSEQKARKFIAVVSRDFKRRYPNDAGRLVAHWRPVAHTAAKREAGNAVTLSFYLEEA